MANQKLEQQLRGAISKQSLSPPVTDWAVGHIKGGAMIALKLNAYGPFFLRPADARKIAAVLGREADAIAEN